MKPLFITLSAAALSLTIACGSFDKATQSGASGPGQEPTITKSGETQTQSNFGSMLVDSSKDLPACNSEKKGVLAYVKSEEKFYVCSGEWGAVSIKGEKGEQGSPGTNGLGITKIQLLKADSTNYCTQFTTIERCYFLGGQVTRFNDGHMLVTAKWQYSSYSVISSDADYDLATQTFIVPKDFIGMTAKLHTMVARSNGYKDVFLVYVRSSESFTLVYDNNDNGEVDGSDLVLASIVVQDF